MFTNQTVRVLKKSLPQQQSFFCSSLWGPLCLYIKAVTRWRSRSTVSLQLSQLDRADVTLVWSIKATSTSLLVWSSHDMSLSIHNCVTDIFCTPLQKMSASYCPCTGTPQLRAAGNTKWSPLKSCYMQIWHVRIIYRPVTSWWIP